MCYGQKMKYCVMNYTNEDIEFAIRLLNHREEVPEEEAQAWLAEPGHEELVDELALIRKVLSAQKGHEAQPAEMPRLQRRGNGRKLRRRIAGWCAAAAAIAVLAIVGGLFKGEITGGFWMLLFLKLAAVFFVIFFAFPRIARYFFHRNEDNVAQFIFVLAMTFLGAWLMEIIGMEGLLGAFLTGLVLNRYVPHLSPLMLNLEFVGIG